MRPVLSSKRPPANQQPCRLAAAPGEALGEEPGGGVASTFSAACRRWATEVGGGIGRKRRICNTTRALPRCLESGAAL